MTSRSSLRTARRAHALPAGGHLRRHRRDVARWALANGHVVRRDALAALLGAWTAGEPDRVPLRWTAGDVARVLDADVARWCLAHGVEPPDELAATLATYLRYLSAHRLFATGSDDMGTLRRAIALHRGGGRSSRDRHPAGSGRAPVLPLA